MVMLRIPDFQKVLENRVSEMIVNPKTLNKTDGSLKVKKKLDFRRESMLNIVSSLSDVKQFDLENIQILRQWLQNSIIRIKSCIKNCESSLLTLFVFVFSN